MLDGWESSRGARTELAVARAIGLRVLNPDLTPHRLDGPVAGPGIPVPLAVRLQNVSGGGNLRAPVASVGG